MTALDPHTIPQDPAFDATLALLRDGYRFIARRCDRLGTNVFATRIMLRSAICLQGPRAMRLLYGAPGLTRQGAMPPTTLRLLQDKGSVQQLEGSQHHHRKQWFVQTLIEEPAAEELAIRFRDDWTDTLAGRDRAEILATASDSLARVACRWMGLPEVYAQDERFRKTLYLMSARSGRFSPSTVTALLRRNLAEARLRGLIREVRQAPDNSLVGRLATARNPEGELLSETAVVVELLNVLRPIVAVGRYIAFAAARLVEEPAWRARLADDFGLFQGFAEEVRRHAPFFPFIAAVTTERLTHEGLAIPKDQWVIADIWGTLHDPAAWPAPERFLPDRGSDWREENEAFCPQGAGAVQTTHRCPGERITVALIAAGLDVLCRHLTWTAPEQDLAPKLSRIPTQPGKGVVLQSIRRSKPS